MDTLCKDCVFAKWTGNEQSGCEFDRIHKFEAVGVKVDGEQSDEKLYCRIVGRVCNTCRHISTLKGIPRRKWKEHVRAEVIPRITMAVYVDNDDSLNEVHLSLRSIFSQTKNPFEVLIIYNCDSKEAPPDYAAFLSENSNGLNWRVESIYGYLDPIGALQNADYGASVDLAVKSKEMKGVYFSVCKAGYVYPPDYIERIDTAINEKMDKFVALLPDHDGNAMFIQTGIHNLLQGNKVAAGCNNIIEKLQAIASEENTTHMIKSFGDI